VPDLPVVVRLKRNGTVVSTADLVDVRAYLSLLETSSAVIRFADPTMEKIDSDEWTIGSELVVEAESGSTSTTVFSGEVVALGADQRGDSRHEFVVEAMDKSHRLSASLTAKTYLEQTYSDVVSAIASGNGLSAECTATTIQHEYLLQTVTDRAYLSFLADDIGFEWFVDGNKLVFRKRPPPDTVAATLKWSSNLTRFEARANAADVAKQITVRGWDGMGQLDISATASSTTADTTQIGSTSPLASSVVKAGVRAFGGAGANLAQGVVQDQGEAQLRSNAIAADVQASTMRVSGEADATPAIKPGVWIDVQECGTNLSGKYYVTECEHVFGANQPFRTRFKMTGRRASGLSSRDTGNTSRGFGQVGLVVGVVTNLRNRSDEGAAGRVRVRFPALPSLESAWARVVTLGGGGARGGLEMRPEVDDEVLVAFEHGDLRRPYVIGGLLNKNDSDRIGALADGKVVNRGIRTRTGNSLVMSDGENDASGERHITFTTADTKSIVRVGEDKVSVTTAADKPIELVSGQASIKIDNGAITITAKSFAVKTQQGAKIEGMTVDLKGSTAVAIDGGAKLEGKGAMVQISADGIATIKGSMLKLN
jgi:phage protein D